MTLAFRPAEPADRNFIVDAWSGSYSLAFTAGMIQIEDWHQVMVPQIVKALARPDVRTVVAYETTETSHTADLFGFLTVDTVEAPALVYYCYTKEPYRRAGVARGLFRAAGIDPRLPFRYVCSTPMTRTLERKIPLAKWQPLLGRFPKNTRRNR